MFTTDDPSVYIERAQMHEQLAAATDDIPARKIHLAMAAEYRRKAKELSAEMFHAVPTSPTNRVLKLDVAIP
jgi:hypothetical protein